MYRRLGLGGWSIAFGILAESKRDGLDGMQDQVGWDGFRGESRGIVGLVRDSGERGGDGVMWGKVRGRE
jgi:hypothetical protein